MLETIIGNEQFKNNILCAMRNKRMAHSVMLCGEDGCGKNYVAKCLAADYLSPNGGALAKSVMDGTCGECLMVDGEGASQDIKAERVREIRKEIYNTSLSSEGRVVIIRNAQNLNLTSGNILLKTLEEPPHGVLFILTAPSPATVLATIRSRCVVYTLNAVTTQECENALKKKYPRAKNLQELSQIFGGKIGMVEKCLSSKAVSNIFDDANAFCNSVQNQNEYNCLLIFTKYEKDKQKIYQLLQYVIALFANNLQKGDERSADNIEYVRNAVQNLKSNVNTKLVLTQLAVQLCAI